MPTSQADSNLKPSKPYPTFPLTAHANGQWCKKIRGKVHFFGVWADPKAALDKYTRQAANLHAGRKPRLYSEDGATIKTIANHYLAAQLEKANRDLITPASFNDCLYAIKAFVRAIGGERPLGDVGPEDFGKYRLHLYDRLGVCAIERSITIIRSMFTHAYEADMVDQPMKYGGQFDKPTQKEKRQNRTEHDRAYGKRLFTAKEIWALLNEANPQLKAMILLGINGGFGNTDCAELPVQAVNLKQRVIDYDRPKTAVQRVVPLWPETTEALKKVLNGERPKARRPEYEQLVFLTTFGNSWTQEMVRTREPDQPPKVSRQSAVVLEFGKLLKRLDMKQQGRGFYALRHTFRTWADETHDQHAVHRIMGHTIPGMSGIYIEEVGLPRLRAVVNHVRKKLFSHRQSR